MCGCWFQGLVWTAFPWTALRPSLDRPPRTALPLDRPNFFPFPPQNSSGLHRTTREPKRATLQGPGASKHHQNSTRRPPKRKEKNEFCGGREKKREILGPPPSGPDLSGSKPFGPPPPPRRLFPETTPRDPLPESHPRRPPGDTDTPETPRRHLVVNARAALQAKIALHRLK